MDLKREYEDDIYRLGESADAELPLVGTGGTGTRVHL